MKTIIRFLEQVIIKITSNAYLKSISNGMVATISLTMIGSIMGLLLNLPVKFESVDKILNLGIQFSSNLLGLWAIFLVSTSYAELHGANKLNSGILSIVSYLILLPINSQGMLELSWIGPRGVVSGIVLSLFISKVYFLIEGKIVNKIKCTIFEDGGLLFVSLPIVIIGSLLLRSLFLMTQYKYFVIFIGRTLLVLLTSIGGTLPGILLSVAFLNILFYYGIHGATIVLPFMSPVWVSYGVENLVANSVGSIPPHIIESGLFRIYSEIGGAASLVGFVICINLFGKSEHYKFLKEKYSVTTITNIGEPLIYGLPLKNNKGLLFPMVVAPTTSILIAYLAIYYEFVPRLTGISVPNGLPVLLDSFLVGGIPHLILQITIIIITSFIYLPFVIKTNKRNK